MPVLVLPAQEGEGLRQLRWVQGFVGCSCSHLESWVTLRPRGYNTALSTAKSC